MPADAAQGVLTAVLVPCFNESATIAGVVEDFRRVLPEATVYVFDNMSTDDTAQVARAAGAVVIPAMRRGKGPACAPSHPHRCRCNTSSMKWLSCAKPFRTSLM